MTMNKELLDNNYIVIPNFIIPDDALSLGKQFEQYCNEIDAKDDPQAPGSQAVYTFTPFLELMLASTYRISYIAQTPLFPTYCFSRVYTKGNVLEKHKDRHSCEVSLTLCLDENGPQWPIYMTRPDGTVGSFALQPGDAIMYLGCRSVHWREANPLPKYTQVFMHYVKADGPFAENAFEFVRKGILRNDSTTTR